MKEQLTTQATSKWYDFYQKRINSSYQEYFNKKYKPMLDFIISFNPDKIIEAGCGIGSISKAFKDTSLVCGGFDIDSSMVSLANQNYGKDIFYQGDIFELPEPKELVVTHGVLEHFEDSQILEILKLYPNSIHYVPLDPYHTPSFGLKDYSLRIIGLNS